MHECIKILINIHNIQKNRRIPRISCVALLPVTLPITLALLSVAALEIRAGHCGSLDGIEHRFSEA